MADVDKLNVVLADVVRHVTLALELLHRVGALPAREHTGQLFTQAKKAEDGYPLDALMSLLRRHLLEQMRQEDLLTSDIVEIRGRLGTEDSRELKINGWPPLKLGRREHLVLTVLAQFARYRAQAPQTGRRHLSGFLPVSIIVGVIDQLTGDGGPLSGLWPTPMELDVHRCVGKLRGRLQAASLNPLLIESGQRGAGYRLSTPAGNVVVEDGQAPPKSSWAAFFESVVRKGQDVQGIRSSGGPRKC